MRSDRYKYLSVIQLHNVFHINHNKYSINVCHNNDTLKIHDVVIIWQSLQNMIFRGCRSHKDFVYKK